MKIGIFVVVGAALGLVGCSDSGADDGAGGASNAGSGGNTSSAGTSTGGSASGATSGGAAGSMSSGGMSGGTMSGGMGGGSSVKPEDSPECTAFCTKLEAMCDFECDKSFDCSIDPGQCAASTIAYLKCVAEKGQLSCGADGFTVIGCGHDEELCN